MAPYDSSMSEVEILIPTYGRSVALAVCLAGLVSQTWESFHVIIADQNGGSGIAGDHSLQAVGRILEAKGHAVDIVRNIPRHGLAQQRQFLLDRARAPLVLYLDDDVFLEKEVITNLVKVIREEGCGFAGEAVTGLSFIDDYRPEEETVEFWESRVKPERVRPGTPAWDRHRLHNAANLFHVQKRMGLGHGNPRPYKVAWVGGCVMYDRQKLIASGGYRFWEQVPREHCGEDVYAQLRVMEKYGGCGVIPSGAYHLEYSTTIKDRTYNIPEKLL